MLPLPSQHIPIVVAARPGVMRDSLLAFLRACERVEVVAQADDARAALEAVRCHQPHALVMDADLASPDEESLLALVGILRTEWPALNSVVLTNGFGQQRTFLAAGASHALLKGTLDERLQIAVSDQRAADSGWLVPDSALPRRWLKADR